MSSYTNNISSTLNMQGNESQTHVPVFQSKSEKLAYLKKVVSENSRLNPNREKNITLIIM